MGYIAVVHVQTLAGEAICDANVTVDGKATIGRGSATTCTYEGTPNGPTGPIVVRVSKFGYLDAELSSSTYDVTVTLLPK